MSEGLSDKDKSELNEMLKKLIPIMGKLVPGTGELLGKALSNLGIFNTETSSSAYTADLSMGDPNAPHCPQHEIAMWSCMDCQVLMSIPPLQPDAPNPPPSLSDAIKEGSKKSGQAIGTFFSGESGFPIGEPIYLNDPPKFVKSTKRITPAVLYSSFAFPRMGADSKPVWQKIQLFQYPLGQMEPGTKESNDYNTWIQTNMVTAGGIIPLGRKYSIQDITIETDIPQPYPWPIHRMLMHSSLLIKTPVNEYTLGNIGMMGHHLAVPITLEPGMDFRFEIDIPPYVQEAAAKYMSNPWWRFWDRERATMMRVWVVMRGIVAQTI